MHMPAPAPSARGRGFAAFAAPEPKPARATRGEGLVEDVFNPTTTFATSSSLTIPGITLHYGDSDDEPPAPDTPPPVEDEREATWAYRQDAGPFRVLVSMVPIETLITRGTREGVNTPAMTMAAEEKDEKDEEDKDAWIWDPDRPESPDSICESDEKVFLSPSPEPGAAPKAADVEAPAQKAGQRAERRASGSSSSSASSGASQEEVEKSLELSRPPSPTPAPESVPAPRLRGKRSREEFEECGPVYYADEDVRPAKRIRLFE